METKTASVVSVKSLRADPIIEKALSLVEQSESAISLERVEREMRVLHESRTSRKLYKAALEPSSLSEASLRDMSNRSRLSELKAQVYVQKNALDVALEAATAHMTTKYAAVLREVASTAGDRKYVIRKVLNPLVARIGELGATMEVLDIHIKDIDQAAWSVKVAADMLKVILERQGANVV